MLMSRVKDFFDAKGKVRVLLNDVKNLDTMQKSLESKLSEKDVLIAGIKKELADEKNKKETARGDEREKAILETYRLLTPLLINYYTVNARIHENPGIKAADMMGMFKPLVHYCAAMDIETIGRVGEKTVFNPSIHSCDTDIPEGAAVIVDAPGFKRKDIILTKALVMKE